MGVAKKDEMWIVDKAVYKPQRLECSSRPGDPEDGLDLQWNEDEVSGERNQISGGSWRWTQERCRD